VGWGRANTEPPRRGGRPSAAPSARAGGNGTRLLAQQHRSPATAATCAHTAPHPKPNVNQHGIPPAVKKQYAKVYPHDVTVRGVAPGTRALGHSALPAGGAGGSQTAPALAPARRSGQAPFSPAAPGGGTNPNQDAAHC
jgi:hypothetical protein